MENKINVIDWNKFNEIILNLANEIKKDYKPDIILSVVRGGMIPSVLLSHKLEVREVENIIVEETEDDSINARKHLPIIQNSNNLSSINNKKILIVDDILGSGQTIKILKKEIYKFKPKEIKTVVCFVNRINWNKSNDENYYNLIDYVGEELKGWVIFPWENK